MTTESAQQKAEHLAAFEVVDVSSEESYYTIGIWPTLESAVEAMRKLGANAPGEHDDDCCVVEIRERKIGILDWSETGKVRWKFVWEKTYQGSNDTYEWRVKETCLSADLTSITTPPIEAQEEVERLKAALDEWSSKELLGETERCELDALRIERDTLRQTVAEAERVIVGMCSKLRLINNDPVHQSVWLSAALHHIDYSTGPTYEKELEALEQFLTKLHEEAKG